MRTERARPAALCAALSGRWPGSRSDALLLLDSYARLASLWVDESQSRVRFDRSRDAATGCLTYAALLHRLDTELNRCRRRRRDLACCFVEVHTTPQRWDGVLAEVGRVLRGVVDDGGAIGRYGSRRFIIVLPGARADVAAAASREAVAALKAIRGHGGLMAWAGVAEWIPGTGADRLLGDADGALTRVLRSADAIERVPG